MGNYVPIKNYFNTPVTRTSLKKFSRKTSEMKELRKTRKESYKQLIDFRQKFVKSFKTLNSDAENNALEFNDDPIEKEIFYSVRIDFETYDLKHDHRSDSLDKLASSNLVYDCYEESFLKINLDNIIKRVDKEYRKDKHANLFGHFKDIENFKEVYNWFSNERQYYDLKDLYDCIYSY